ncbi:MAG TPA: glycosyltransferase family 2 protein [Deltaproteobacteria bacterium]|nr:glycosyltransferase family 2 protein [Deltaproteobacteria bacterium]HIJ39983.1 glycosyltransferase family 2 protein [Deltaproteobacteria bacterium]
MKLSVIIPCYNEKATLAELIALVRKSPVRDVEIILVDDCSTDGTTELIRNHIEKDVDRVIYHESNMGKGAAIRSGLKYITGDVAIIQDADLEYDPMEYPKLLTPILDGKADVVYGSRFLGDGPHRVHLFWHYVGNRLLTLLSNMFTNLNLSDMETCYKMMKAEIVRQIVIEQDRFGMEPEITAKIARLKCRIFEVGVSYYGRTYEEGKKINWKDGFKAIYCILRYGIFR